MSFYSPTLITRFPSVDVKLRCTLSVNGFVVSTESSLGVVHLIGIEPAQGDLPNHPRYLFRNFVQEKRKKKRNIAVVVFDASHSFVERLS